MKEKCKVCGLKETELSAVLPPGFWICSPECYEISLQHPERDPKVEVLPDESEHPNRNNYRVTWPGEVNAEGRQMQFVVTVNRDLDLYLCPCRQVPAPHLEFRGKRYAVYLRGVDPITTACHHIGAVLMLEHGLSQELKTPV